MSTVLTLADLTKAAKLLQIDVAVIRAIDQVESNGAGFDKDGRVKILFEPATFNRMTKGAFLGIDVAKNVVAAKFGDRSSYSLDQHQQLKRAIDLQQWAQIATATDPSIRAAYPDPKKAEAAAALIRQVAPGVESMAYQSASWGRYQIMGFNFRFCGYRLVADFVAAMRRSEAEHLAAFVNFVIGKNLSRHLQAKNYDAFFTGYNGPQYKKMKYDQKFFAALKQFNG